MTPANAPIFAPAPISIPSEMPTFPPIITPSPTVTEPASPACPQMTHERPTRQPWAICTRLSILVPLPMVVDPNLARSTQELAPISTWSPMTTLPMWGILTSPRPSGAGRKPKPSPPMDTHGWKLQSSPTTQRSSTDTPGLSVQRAPTFAPAPM
jgi:hypothetical protein